MEDSLLLSHAADLLKAVGMVGAGFWAAWTFHKLQKPLAAELENRKKLVDVQKARLEQEDLRAQLLSHQPNPDITLQATHYPDDASPRKTYLSVTVTIANRGTQNFEIVFSESTVTIARLETTPRGKQSAVTVQRVSPWLLGDDTDDLQPFPERSFRVGAVRRMVFVTRCSEAGVYLLQFRAKYRRMLFDDDPRKGDPTAVWVDAVEQSVYLLPAHSDA